MDVGVHKLRADEFPPGIDGLVHWARIRKAYKRYHIILQNYYSIFQDFVTLSVKNNYITALN
jgi:hypothetical protein